MSDQDRELVYRVRTEADLRAFEDSKRALEKQRAEYVALGKATTELDREIKKVDATLESSAAKSLRIAEAWNKNIEAVRRAGGNTDAMVAERNTILHEGGLTPQAGLARR
jgi:uncharacterized protein YlxW (UPF0749 family)